MCGRYQLHSSVVILAQTFRFVQRPNLEQRYNIAPTQSVPVVRMGEEADHDLVTMRWGLVPFWAKDLAIGSKMINARAETVETLPSFRAAFRARRCLIPADGFYEWQKTPGSKTKQPFLIRHADSQPFAFAGLWERWKGPDGVVESCTIITTTANDTLTPIHDRMPVILHEDDHDRWLDLKQPQAAELLKPAANDLLVTIPIGTSVNNVRNEGAELMLPLNPK